MIPVILSGGSGSRLWPLSRGMYPKQLLPLADAKLSLLQQTVLRASTSAEVQAPVVVCNDQHRFMVAEQLRQIDAEQATIILEPEGKNTAPAIALAAFQIASTNPDQIIAAMPADHVVADTQKFADSLAVGVALAKRGNLVTFGIVPTHAETGFGYIRRGAEAGEGAFEVAEFKEKPAAETALQYVESGEYYWNGGIFVFRVAEFLSELKRYCPDVYAACEKAVAESRPDLDFMRVDEKAFVESPSISIDYAVMEHTDKAVVVPLDVGWNDVGSWSALWDVSDKDQHGNAISGDVLVHDTSNSHIYAETKLVSAVGVQDLVIVETDDAVMVTHRDQSQDVKEMVEALKRQDRSQVKHHRKVYRPWGWFDSIDSGERFQVKRIQVKPGARLSVQMHHHRAEHWVVVSGTAEVLNGEDTFLLKENESTYIPVGTTHALRNPSDQDPLEIIEVQSGSYLGEDDIVRFEDNYGRAGTTE